ncbi:MAG: hypothetical protein Q8O46_04050 [bacterium]|nr:hypothetical protein [bacterium]
MPFGVLVSKTDNIFGSWNALGIFAGFLGVISLSVIEFFHISRMAKWILGILLPLSIFFTAIVNFSLIWALLGIFALIIFVFKTLSYSVAKQTENDNVRFPAFSLAVFAISLLFFMSGQFIGEFLPNRLGISRAEEVTPTLTTTMLIAKKTLTKDPIFGAGPNRFGEMWAMHKTASINSGRFWDTYFDFGSGLLPTFAVTTGIVGIIAWLAFFYMFFITGMKSIFFTIKKRVNPEMMVFFMASFYLFTASFFYPTGIVMFFLAFIFAGVFVGLSVGNGSSSEISLSFFNNPVKSFFSTIFLVFLMIFTIVASFKFMERFVSVSYFGKTLMAPTIPIAESSITKAIMLNSNDLYLRTYAQVYLVKLNSQIAENSSGEGGANVALQATFDQAVNGAILATTYNSTNYLNFKALGVVYESVASLGVLGAYDKAIESYKTASDLNPLNPALKLSIARVSFASDKTKEAKDYGEQAITLKPDYIEALIVLSQITKSEGDIRQALSYAERALSFSPSDKDLIQYVNSLR